jgi:putative hydrolase of the HAD superfamily
MAFYKHYSFDLWLTLIKSNPLFKQARAHYFYSKFNNKHKHIDEITAAFRKVDLMVNAINEKTGKNVDADEMYLMVMAMINEDEFSYHEIDLVALEQEMETLLLTHMPLLYCNECIEVLSNIKATKLSTTNILSNTGFIRGTTLRKVLKHLEIDRYLDFQLYSDEVRMSKPNPGFFKLMLDGCKNHHQNIEMHEILHVGDNPFADIKGAQNVGINSMLINSNHRSISHVLS